MSVVKYLQKWETGLLQKNSAWYSKENTLNFDFILPRLGSCENDVFVVTREDEDEVPPTAARFCPKYGREHIVAVANEDGSVVLLNTNVPIKRGLLTQWNAHMNAIFDICWTGSNLLTASGDKTIQLWDTTVQKHITTMKGHTSSVKTLDLQPYSSSVFATGSRDGSIMVWDIRMRTSANHHLPVIVIHNAHDVQSTLGTLKQRRRVILPKTMCVTSPLNTISNVLYQREHILLSAGASDSEIKLWDLRTSGKESTLKKRISSFGETVKPKGYSSLALHPSQTTFFASGVDGVIYQYSCSNSDLVATYYGHKVNTFFVKMASSADGEYIVSGSSDEKAYIWKVSKPGPPLVALSGHLDEVTCVAWCPSDLTKVITCSDDSQVFCWNLALKTPSPSWDSKNNLVGEPEEIDREATKPPPGLASLTSGKSKMKEYRTPKSCHGLGCRDDPPVLTRWLTPQRKTDVVAPINVTPVKRTFTLPRKRQLSGDDSENWPAAKRRVPRAPDGTGVLTQRHGNTVARSLTSTFTVEESRLGESSKKQLQIKPTQTRKRKPSTKTRSHQNLPVKNSIKNYFKVLSTT